MRDSSSQRIRVWEALIIVLFLGRNALALPASAPLVVRPSDHLFQLSNVSWPSAPPSTPHCDHSLGTLKGSDCTEAIKLLPHDPLARPVLRNFYTDPSDASTTMPNQQVPFQMTYGDCTAQILLATNFNDVPHDQSSWINLIGPARVLMRACPRDKGTGGVIVRNGDRQNLEIVLYNKESLYGKVDILRNSRDPVAVSIAEQELLELLNLAPNIVDDPEDLLLNHTSSINTAKSESSAPAEVEAA